MAKTLRERLVGTWKLVSYVERATDGSEPVHPFGKDAKGIIMYTPDGYMSAQLERPGRPEFASDGSEEETRQEATGYIAYSGPFFTDEAAQRLEHSMFVSLFPNWSGQRQARVVKIEGDLLHLSTEKPIGRGGKETMAFLTWKRAEPNG